MLTLKFNTLFPTSMVRYKGTKDREGHNLEGKNGILITIFCTFNFFAQTSGTPSRSFIPPIKIFWWLTL